MASENEKSFLTPGFLTVWIGVCTATALAVTAVVAAYEPGSFFKLIGRNLLSTHAIGFGAVLTGHWAYQKWRKARLWDRYFLVVSASILGGVGGRTLLIAVFQYWKVFEPSDLVNPYGYAATVFITFMVSSATFLIWSLQKPLANADPTDAPFSFRSARSEHGFIPIKKIIYLTAMGKKTILHTEDGDLQTSEMMKDLLTRLPAEKFLRVHKKYAVQLVHVSSIRHLRSGHYAVFLKNEDYIVSASSRFAKILKVRLGL